MHRRLAAILFSLIVSLMALTGPGCGHGPKVVSLATTTTIEGSGLLAVLVNAMKADLGLDVQAVIGGTARALEILSRGDADMAFTHDPDAERAARETGTFADYRKVMYNDFVIAGPPTDPSGIKAATSASDAMGRIADSTTAFASRADSSGTHSRELLLWKQAGRRPAGARLIEVGQSMSTTLRVASERQAYVLADRATLTQIGSSLRLTLLYEGDPALINTYAASYRTGLTGTRLDNARKILDWLTEGRGRDAISSFTIKGQPAFHLWPTARPRSQPGDLPNGR